MNSPCSIRTLQGDQRTGYYHVVIYSIVSVLLVAGFMLVRPWGGDLEVQEGEYNADATGAIQQCTLLSLRNRWDQTCTKW